MTSPQDTQFMIAINTATLAHVTHKEKGLMSTFTCRNDIEDDTDWRMELVIPAQTANHKQFIIDGVDELMMMEDDDALLCHSVDGDETFTSALCPRWCLQVKDVRVAGVDRDQLA